MEKEIRRSVCGFARAVRKVADLQETPDRSPNAEYHVAEYLQDMEYMLLEQLMTSTENQQERERVLVESELEYLLPHLQEMASDWEIRL